MQPQRLFRLSIPLFLLLALLAGGLRAATSKLDLTTGAVQDPCVFAAMRANFRVDNRDSSAINANTLTVRFYFNAAEAVSTAAGFLLYIYDSGGSFLGWTTITATSTVMGSTCTLGGRSANRYVDYTFGSFSIPAGGYASPNGGYVDLTRAGSGAFDSACDDYSGTNSTGFNQINRMTLYQSGSLVCEYSSSSTQDANTGVEPCTGAGGCGAAATPTPTWTPTATPVQSPTFTRTNSPVLTPTITVTPSYSPTASPVYSPTFSPTKTLTHTFSPTSTTVTTPVTPTQTRTPGMAITKSVNTSVAIMGDTLTFYLDWSNDASASVTYNLWDSVSPYLTYLGCNNGCTSSGSIVNWSFSAASGSSGQVAFWAKITGMP